MYRLIQGQTKHKLLLVCHAHFVTFNNVYAQVVKLRSFKSFDIILRIGLRDAPVCQQVDRA